MRQRATTRTKGRGVLGRTIVGLLVLAAATTALVVYRPASAAPALNLVLPGNHVASTDDDGAATRDGAVTKVDGLLPDGVTAFDDEYPGIANLEPDLLQALRSATTSAANDGVQIFVNSGWRSPDYQAQLFREAVAEYGSEEQAARWVATPETSDHVSGKAVDIGSFDATAWLADHGAEYGLCRTYRNEPWHFELRPAARNEGCPAMRAADPARSTRIPR